jgi:hypothetical protein
MALLMDNSVREQVYRTENVVDYLTSDVEWRVWKCLQGTDRGVTEVLSRNFPRESEDHCTPRPGCNPNGGPPE